LVGAGGEIKRVRIRKRVFGGGTRKNRRKRKTTLAKSPMKKEHSRKRGRPQLIKTPREKKISQRKRDKVKWKDSFSWGGPKLQKGGEGGKVVRGGGKGLCVGQRKPSCTKGQAKKKMEGGREGLHLAGAYIGKRKTKGDNEGGKEKRFNTPRGRPPRRSSNCMNAPEKGGGGGLFPVKGGKKVCLVFGKNGWRGTFPLTPCFWGGRKTLGGLGKGLKEVKTVQFP